MQTTVGTASVRLENYGSPVIVQNLGPGTVYFDFESTVTTATGFKLGVDETYESPRNTNGQPFSVISDAADTDVRWNRMGY